MCKSKHFLLTILVLSFLFTVQFANAQLWDAGGDGTSWDDPLNWDGDAVPVAGAFVDFNTSTTLTFAGTGSALAPAQLKVRGATTVVNLGFNLDIGDPTSTDPATVINSGATLNILAGTTFILDPPVTENAIQVNAGGSFTVQLGANVVVLKALRGINLTSSLATVTNNGLISLSNCSNHAVRLAENTGFLNSGQLTINSPARSGIYNLGGFVNLNGKIEINSPVNRGIECVTAPLPDVSTFVNAGAASTIIITTPGDDGIRSETAFLNDVDATIFVNEATDDGIELVGNIFTNNGTINITCRAGALPSGPGVAVGTNTVAATLINTSNNSLNIDAGGSTNGRSIFIYDMGTLQNTGTIDVSGGSPTLTFFNRGILSNGIGGTIELNDRRLTNGNMFENDGLISSMYPSGPGVFTNGTGNSTNRAFYRYQGISAFSNGAGAITNNGIDLQDSAQTTIDFGGTCDAVIPIGVMYTWINGPNTIGINGEMGAIGDITANPGSIDASDLTMSPSVFTSILLDIINVCSAALPVELVDFKAVPNDKSVLLQWQTASETNNDFMAVERSYDARVFEEIGRRAGAINSQQLRRYELEDMNPQRGINYYRLRQVDIDGTTTYSDVISVRFAGKDDMTIQPLFYPNVIRNSNPIQLDLRSFPTNEIVTLKVVDMHGKTWSLINQTGGTLGEVVFPHLPAGTYLLVASNHPQAATHRFVIIE